MQALHDADLLWVVWVHSGRWFTLIPFRNPIVVIVGSPIVVGPAVAAPTESRVDALHNLANQHAHENEQQNVLVQGVVASFVLVIVLFLVWWFFNVFNDFNLCRLFFFFFTSLFGCFQVP